MMIRTVMMIIFKMLGHDDEDDHDDAEIKKAI